MDKDKVPHTRSPLDILSGSFSCRPIMFFPCLCGSWQPMLVFNFLDKGVPNYFMLVWLLRHKFHWLVGGGILVNNIRVLQKVLLFSLL